MMHSRVAKIYEQYRGFIDRAARQYGLDPYLIAAVIYHESGGNPKAVSRAGARGLMQVMPSTARGLGVSDPDQLFDPETNIQLGARYLSMMLSAFGNNLEHALAAYNAGPNAVKKHQGIPPYRETQHYVRAVLKTYNQVRSKQPPQWGLMLADWLLPQNSPNLLQLAQSLPQPLPQQPVRTSNTPIATENEPWFVDWLLKSPPPTPMPLGIRGHMPHEIPDYAVPFGKSFSVSSSSPSSSSSVSSQRRS